MQSAVGKKLQRSEISATEVGQTNMIVVMPVSPDPARAAKVADTDAKAFVSRSTETAISSLSTAENQLGDQITIGNSSRACRRTPRRRSCSRTSRPCSRGNSRSLRWRGATASTLTSGATVEQIVNAPVRATAPVVAAWRKKSRPVVISVSDPTSQPTDLGLLARGRT